MRNIDRIDNFLHLLGEEWKRQGQDLRFTQFLFNNGINNLASMSMYGMEENKLLQIHFPNINPREYLYWGTYGKDGDQPLKYKLIKDLDTDHIKAILETQHHINDLYKSTLENELQLRNT